MINFIKKIFYKILGRSAYLKSLRIGFFILYHTGYLKKDPAYKYHYFVKNLIAPGDYVVDLGANLGYFTGIFSQLAGAEGRVIAIEPVRPFFETLQWALKHKKNCVLYNYALGSENKKIEMLLPKTQGPFRTGLAHVGKDAAEKENSFVFETEMVIGSALLKDLPHIDYIKCDIEGYEVYVLPELKEIITHHKPILQIETWGSQKNAILAFMQNLGYMQYSVYKNKIVKEFSHDIEFGDYLFIHADKEPAIIERLKRTGCA